MKIAIVSDSHDAWVNLEKAITVANEVGCGALLHAGDFVTPSGIKVLSEFKGEVHMVWGNNEGEKVGFIKTVEKFDNIVHHGDVMEKEFGGLLFFMNHYPTFAKNAAESGKYDVSIFGHTHLYVNEQVGDTLLLNPGEIVGTKTGTSTMIIFDTQTKHVEKIELASSLYTL